MDPSLEVGVVAPFISSLIIILREGFEAILIVSLVFAYLKKMDVEDKNSYVWGGIAAGIAGSIAIAVGFTFISGLTHAHEEIFEGTTMLIAAGFMTYVAFWCHGAQEHFESGIIKSLTFGTSLALSATVCFAVLREGFEVVLFYAGLFASDIADKTSIYAGGLVGLVCLYGIWYTLDNVSAKIPTFQFFKYSKYFLGVLALYFAYNGCMELLEGFESTI
tara:strand:+ start:256 stop:912 length:657 start_codon:yes stop_codon:yes gene_type:complete